MKAKLLQILTAVLLLTAGMRAQELASVAGAFVDVGYGARPMGLGGAYVGLANDVNAVLWNPAGLTNIESKEVTFSFHNQFGLVKYNYLGYAMPYNSGLDGLGLAFIYSGDEAMNEMTVQVGYGRKVWKDLTVGGSIKYRRSSFGNNTLGGDDYRIFEPDEIAQAQLNQVKGGANGFGFDIGVLFKVNDKVNMGIMLKDIYSPVFWDSKVDNPAAKAKGSYSELVPFESVVGTSFRISDNFMFTADYLPSLSKDVYNKIRGGAEIRLFNFLFVRAGVQNTINNVEDERIVLGTGLKFKIFGGRFVFDYTNVIENLANTSRLTFGLEF
ncbi:MAG: hypothetical protein HRU80_00740 [Ignavibacteriales bacterium]|nr:hypothetical protein [Ignavibacteriaceae bacterium]QOJ27467.1 MAG: hypothetical protein HRU80_00740 [Ignavibacteriales bacterium]